MAVSSPQPFMHHIQELRTRLIVCVAVVLLGSCLAYWQRTLLFTWLQRPIHSPLYYTTPSGAFQYVMLVCLATGAILATPIILYELLAFIAPAFAATEKLRRTAIRTIMTAFFLAAAGVAFGYIVILPVAFSFFSKFGSVGLHPLITASDYLSFTAGCLMVFAAIFQLPLVLYFIDRIKPIPPARMMRYQRHVIIGSLIIALILPFTYDPLSQFLIAVPIIVLYEFSIIMLWTVHLARRPRRVRTPKVTTEQAELQDEPGDGLVSAPRWSPSGAAVTLDLSSFSATDPGSVATYAPTTLDVYRPNQLG